MLKQISFALLILCVSGSVLKNERPSAMEVPRDAATWHQRSSALITVLNHNWFSASRHQWQKNNNGGDLGVWHSWNGLEALIDFSNYAVDGGFDQVLYSVAGNSQLLAAAQGTYNDDALWAGIALLKAYKKSHSQFYLSGAKGVFTQLTQYWDSKCGGGVWWTKRRDYKNAITNELFFVLAVDLYEVTNDVNYLNWAKREYTWFMASGMLNSDNLINDGLTDQCVSNHQMTWTYNQGVIFGGLAGLARADPSNAHTYLSLADRIARAVVAHKTMNSPQGKPILKESDVNGEDGEQFKGIFMRYLGQLITASSDATNKAFYAKFILDNADFVWNNARNDQTEVSAIWVGQRHQPPWYDAIAQISAIDLMNAAIIASKV